MVWGDVLVPVDEDGLWYLMIQILMNAGWKCGCGSEGVIGLLMIVVLLVRSERNHIVWCGFHDGLVKIPSDTWWPLLG